LSQTNLPVIRLVTGETGVMDIGLSLALLLGSAQFAATWLAAWHLQAPAVAADAISQLVTSHKRTTHSGPGYSWP